MNRLPLAFRKDRSHGSPFSLVTRRQADVLFAWFLLLPALLVLVLVMFGPIVNAVKLSFQDYTLRTRNDPAWNNFENYIDLYESGEIQLYFENTLIFVTAVVVLQFVLAMVIALLIGNDLPTRNAFRSLFLMPWTIPSVVTALVWLLLFQPEYGLVNHILDVLGVMDRNTQWVQNPKLAMPAVIIVSVWRQLPIVLVMLVAGLQTIPVELVEAARIDGANAIRVFRHIKLPFLAPIIYTSLLLAIIRNFQMFTLIYNLTAGGPLKRTMTLALATHMEAFRRFDMGKGAAIGVIWLIVLILITLVFNWLNSRSEIE